VDPAEGRAYLQDIFFQVATNLYPPFIEDLFTDVYQSKAMRENIWPRRHEPEVDFVPLREGIENWLHAWHLDAPDGASYWVFEKANRTIQLWCRKGISPFGSVPDTWLWYPTGESVRPPSEDELLWSFEELKGPARRDPISLDFRLLWEPLSEGLRAGRERVREVADEGMDAAEEVAGKLYERTLQKDSDRHFRWLARHVLHGETIEQIANNPGDMARRRGTRSATSNPDYKGIDVKPVLAAVKELADIVVLPLPSKRLSRT
jgi:hypothetical protein